MFNPHKFSPPLLRRILGYAFLIMGVVGGFIPMLQGWIFIILGLLLLKDHAKWAKYLSIWLRKKYPQSRPTIRKLYQKIEEWLAKLGLS